jgi:voltage-gated potassium channel
MGLVTEVPWWFRTVIRRLGQTSTIAVVLALLFASVIVGAGLITFLEIAENGNGPRTYLDALWWFVITITGVGLKAVGPDAPMSKVAASIVLLLARIFFGMFTGAIAAALINRLLMEGKGMGDVVLRNHAVICGWNNRGIEIVGQLVHDERLQDIVILADLESTPIRLKKVHFVRGDPTRDQDLRRASVPLAETVIILADETTPGLSDSTIDARSVLVALAVETINREIYTLAEVRRPENRHHFEHASVNEVVVSTEVVSDLLARTSVHHGLSRIVHDLLTPDVGNEIYIAPAPPSLIGQAFDDALMRLQSREKAILMGVVRGEEIILNPEQPLVIMPRDQLVVMSRDALKME